MAHQYSHTAKPNNHQFIGINGNNNIGNSEGHSKFISKNKSKSHSNNSSFRKVNNSNSNYASHNNHSKLKPVKERRPTALPTDVPHLVGGSDVEDEVDHYIPKQTHDSNGPLTPTNVPGHIAKFFIGNQDDDSDYNSRVSTNSSFIHTTPMQTPTSASIGNPKFESYSSKNSKQSSNARRRDRMSSGQKQQQETVHIPPPPPLPPQSLIMSSSTTSLTSMKKKGSKNQKNSLSTATEPLFSSELDILPNGIEENVSKE